MESTDSQILRDIPEAFETERLLVRVPRPGDGSVLNAAVRESWQDLQTWMPWANGEVPSVAQSETYSRQAYLKYLGREDLPLFIFRKADNVFVGASGMHRINWRVPRVEIGYWVRTSMRGQGYITETVRGIVEFAQAELGVKRVEIRCDRRNERSIAVARRAGFELDAELVNHDRDHVTGALRTTLIFSLTFPD